MGHKLPFGGVRQQVPKYTTFRHIWPKTESAPDQIDVMWVQVMTGGIYKGKRRCSEVTATIGFTLYHMRCKLFFWGSWSAQNDSKWKHSHHVCVHYTLSSDTRVTCVLWGISHALISDMLTGLRLISTCDTVCIMWLQTSCWISYFQENKKKGFRKWLTIDYYVNVIHTITSSRSVAVGCTTWDPWTGLRLHSSLKYVLWCVFDPLTT